MNIQGPLLYCVCPHLGRSAAVFRVKNGVSEGSQSGQHAVFSGVYVMTVLYYVCTRLIW